MDANGRIRDFSGVVSEITRREFSPVAVEKLKAIDPSPANLEGASA